MTLWKLSSIRKHSKENTSFRTHTYRLTGTNTTLGYKSTVLRTFFFIEGLKVSVFNPMEGEKEPTWTSPFPQAYLRHVTFTVDG